MVLQETGQAKKARKFICPAFRRCVSAQGDVQESERVAAPLVRLSEHPAAVVAVPVMDLSDGGPLVGLL